MAPFPAAIAGAYLHGLAGDLTAREIGQVGMVASDLIPMLPRAIRNLGATVMALPPAASPTVSEPG